MTNKPIAILISDIHYSLPTLEVADKALRLAIQKANELDIPLIIAGDLHDTKANLRAECIKSMRDTLGLARYQPYILRGNHDSWNEKSRESALDCLGDIAVIVKEPKILGICLDKKYILGYCIPYYHHLDELRAYLRTIPKGSRLIMHQGIEGSHSGDYIQDRSALKKEDVAGFRIISGHYHRRQTIDISNHGIPSQGKWDYIGNPYTLNFGEASDPEKGFQILFEDGKLEFVPTKLRKHVVIDFKFLDIYDHDVKTPEFENQDLILIKLRGTREQLNTLNKDIIKSEFGITQDFKLDLIPFETENIRSSNVEEKSQLELLEDIVNAVSDISDERKIAINKIWKWMIEK